MGRRDSMSQWGTASETCVEVCSCLRGSTFGHRREQPCKHGGSRGASQEQHGGHVASAKCRRLDYLCSYLTLDHSYLRTGSTVTTKGTLQSPKLRACSLTTQQTHLKWHVIYVDTLRVIVKVDLKRNPIACTGGGREEKVNKIEGKKW